jgi:hypothetical protein
MKTMTRLGTIIAAFVLFGALAPAAPAAGKYFDVAGKVIQIDKNDRTLLVRDRDSKKLYLIELPENARFKITFGRYMRMEEPGLKDVSVGERIQIRCKRGDTEHLTRLDDGRMVVNLTASE